MKDKYRNTDFISQYPRACQEEQCLDFHGGIAAAHPVIYKGQITQAGSTPLSRILGEGGLEKMALKRTVVDRVVSKFWGRLQMSTSTEVDILRTYVHS